MKTLSPIYKSLLSRKKNQGFTLIELLVAILMSGIVMVGLGAAMMAILNNNKLAASKADVKNQINRAVDYINEDVKAARFAGIQETDDTKTTLALTLIQEDGTDIEVKYYLADAGNPWLGPKVLMRQVGTETPQVLVDRLTENIIDATEFECNTADSGVDGTALSIGGFQACVTEATASNDSPIYRTRVTLFGEITDTEGNNANSTVLTASIDTTSRSISPSIDPPVVTFEPLSDLTPTLQWEAIDNATGYEIYRCLTTDSINECEPNQLLGSTTSLTLAETNSDQPGYRVCYAGVTLATPVRSVLGEVQCTIISPENPPATVANDDFTVSDDIQPVVEWTYDSTAIEYRLYRCSTNDTNNPCTIDTDNPDHLVDTFSTLTEVDFDNNVPWSEAINTNNVPDEDNAFCYAVIANNARGDSSLSSTKCGRLNVALTENSAWSIAFTNFDTTQTQPTGVTWNTVTDATRYEIRRCDAASWTDTCDPETEGQIVVDSLEAAINPFQYDEISLPASDSRYCYAVRAKSDTEVSPFSTPAVCAAGRAPECTLDMASLGLGATANYQSAETQGDRDTLIGVVSNFFNTPIEVIDNIGVGNVLHTVEYQDDDGNYQDARDSSDTVTLPCDAQLRFNWYYVPDGSIATPPLNLTPDTGGASDRSTLDWTAVTDADQYNLYRCEANDGETCTPTPNIFFQVYGGSALTYYDSERPANNKRHCYVIEAVDTDPNPDIESDISAPLCGDTR